MRAICTFFQESNGIIKIKNAKIQKAKIFLKKSPMCYTYTFSLKVYGKIVS